MGIDLFIAAIATRFFLDGDAFLSESAPTGIPVVSAMACSVGLVRLRVVMNTTKRLLLGVISSLLLAIGFARAADRLDPMSSSLGVSSNTAGANLLPTPPCTDPCIAE